MNFQDTQDTASTAPSRWLTCVVIGLALTVLGGTLAWSAWELRTQMRAQILQHDGEMLDAVAVLQHLNDQTGGETLTSLAEPGEQFELALKISKLRNVLGVRLYAANGKFVNAFPAYIAEAALDGPDQAVLQQLQPVSHFAAQGRMQDLDLLASDTNATAPLLYVVVPLRTDDQKQLAGSIQFVMDGRAVASQYAELDRNLELRFSLVFLTGAVVLMGGLGWALRREQTANRLLAERTRNLLEANRELALSARMSAVGAVTAHLIHGLKNPLSGLANFVSSQQTGHPANATDWQAAITTTQRMQEMVNRVVRVLQEQQSGVEYEISARELAGLLEQKAGPAARAAGVELATDCSAEAGLSNHAADLIFLVLENLIQNGIQATPAGKQVRLSIVRSREGLVFEVMDQGFGLPRSVLASLFAPCTSTKKGGGGIGLAISKQLAQHLGGTLELTSSSTAGCVFRFIVPLEKHQPLAPAGRELPIAR